MTPQIETITTYVELCARISELQRRYKNLVFRGQTKFYSHRITPSGLRPDRTLEDYSQPELEQMEDRWVHTMGSVLTKLPKSAALKPNKIRGVTQIGAMSGTTEAFGITDEMTEAILQHYGARSRYVDVTKSIDVAIWFSHHRYRMREIKLHKPPDIYRQQIFANYSPIYDVAWYEPAWTRTTKNYGYLFVIAHNGKARPKVRNALRDGDLVDVSNIQTLGRMRQQQAGLLYISGKGKRKETRTLVKAIFRFPLPLEGTPALNWKTTQLFPSPSKDPFFAQLLSDLPFRQVSPKTRSQTQLLRIPEYYNSGNCLRSKEWRQYRIHDRYINPSFVFKALRSAKDGDGTPLKSFEEFTCRFGKRKYDVRKATAILTLKPSDALFAHQPPENFYPPINRLSIFFEYDAIQAIRCKDTYVLPFVERMGSRTKPANFGFYNLPIPHIRAMWLVHQDRVFWCRLFGFDGDTHSMYLSVGSYFTWKKGQLVLADADLSEIKGGYADDERLALTHTLGLLAGIDRGTTMLSHSMKSRGWPYLLLATRHVAFGI